jgi:5-hydroxyisourate hydrolase-like protein (transthyretin family)
MKRVLLPVPWLAMLATIAGVSAQTPARDAPKGVTGTATVSGIVVTDDADARPLRRVHVSLQAIDLRAPIAAVTDDQGRFVLPDVAAGNYNVTASRPGYVDTTLGAKPGGMLGSPIAVSEGQQLTGLTIRMPRGGVITGIVRFPSGRPAPNLHVSVTPLRTFGAKRQAKFSMNFEGAETDDRGVYRQYGLAPGEYLVQLMAGISQLGSDGDLRQITAAEAAWADRAASSGSSGAASGAPPEGRKRLPSPIYYPGTTDIAAARAITIDPGEEKDGIDFVVAYVPTARLSGTVFDVDGRPRAGVTVKLKGKAGSSFADLIGSLIGPGGRTDADGAFAIDSVPPGEYSLDVQATSATDAKPDANSLGNLMSAMSSMFGGGAGAGSLYASERVVVSGQDLANLDLRLRPGSTVSGAVVFEGTATPPSKGQTQVVLAPVSQATSVMELSMSMLQGTSAPLNTDLTFAVKGVVPGRYRASVNLPGMMFGTALPNATWTLKSVRVGTGPDIADTPIEVEAGRDLSGFVVTLTDKPTVLSGKVFDREGRPTSAFPIVIFSTNPEHWLPGSRRVQQVRAANDGTYRLRGLPAGEYYVGAVTTLDLEDLLDPAFLQQIVPIAFKLTLVEGETRQQDLKLGGG